MDYVTFGIALIIFIIVLKIMCAPFKLILKIICNSIIGGLVILICEYFGIGITIYWWTVALTAILGLPGLLLSFLVTFFI